MWLVLSFIRTRRLLYLSRTQIFIQTNSFVSTEIPKPQFHIPKQDWNCWNSWHAGTVSACHLVWFNINYFICHFFGILKPTCAFNYYCLTFEIENWIFTFSICFLSSKRVTPSFKPVFHILNYYFSILKWNT